MATNDESTIAALQAQVRSLQEIVNAQQASIQALERRLSVVEQRESTTPIFGRPPPAVGPPQFLGVPLSVPVTADQPSTDVAVSRPLLEIAPVSATTVSPDYANPRDSIPEQLVQRTLELLNAQPDASEGIWCEACDRPCVDSSHEAADGSAEASKVMVTVDGCQVKVDDLAPNKALDYLVANPNKSGRWCEGHGGREVNQCSFVHRKGDASGRNEVVVEGTPIPLAALERNQAVEMLLTHPTRDDGRWCTTDEATHDVTVCYRVHKRRSCQPESPRDGDASADPCTTEHVLVAGQNVPVRELRRNPAVEYLMRNPTKRGRWCATTKSHNADECKFVHRVDAEPQDAPVDSSAVVNVAGDMVPVTALATNPAVDYLLKNPTRRGRWCHGHGKKSIQECTFVHHKHESGSSRHEAPAADGQDGADAPNDDRRQRRMFVYYEQDDGQTDSGDAAAAERAADDGA